MIDRQCALWKPDAKMCEFLRPETLFGKEKFDNYYAARLVEVKPTPNGAAPPDGGEFCPGWEKKHWTKMTKREIDVYVDR
jgi:hypothetical protein